MADTILAVTHHSQRRDHLAGLIAQLDDVEVEQAIMLMEWLRDPELRTAVDDLAMTIGRVKGQRLEAAD